MENKLARAIALLRGEQHNMQSVEVGQAIDVVLAAIAEDEGREGKIMTKPKRIKLPGVRAYGWQFRDWDPPGKIRTCRWARPFRRDLLADGKPCPGARVIRVRIVAEVELRRLLAAKPAKGTSDGH